MIQNKNNQADELEEVAGQPKSGVHSDEPAHEKAPPPQPDDAHGEGDESPNPLPDNFKEDGREEGGDPGRT